jgi:hypothetical protein
MRGILVLAVAGLLAFPVGAQAHHQDAAQNTRLTNLENRVTALEAARTTATNRLNALEAWRTEATASLTDLDARLDALENPEPEPTPTPTPEPTATPTPTPTPTPTATPTNPEVTLQQVDGGANFWGTSSDFMVGSWFRPVHNQTQVDQYKDFGLNTFIGLEYPEMTQEALLRQNGLKSFVQAGERTRFNDLGSEQMGWNGGDEFDMTASNGQTACTDGRFGQMLANQGISANGLNGDGKLIHYNFGKGLGIWYREGYYSDAQDQCYVNHPALDVVSIDVYYLTDTSTGQWHKRGYSYGTDMEQLRRWDAVDGQRKPMFSFVELGPPGYGETFAPQPAEVRSAVWHSIIAGARGVAYFDHNFGTSTNPPTCHGSTIRGECYPAIRAAAKATNEQIRSLAPVLNSPTVTSGHSLSGATARRLVKWDGQNFYVAIGTLNGGDATFSMPCLGNAAATNLGETVGNLSIPVSNGSFTDSFANKDAVHIYRIDGGSRCGL